MMLCKRVRDFAPCPPVFGKAVEEEERRRAWIAEAIDFERNLARRYTHHRAVWGASAPNHRHQPG